MLAHPDTRGRRRRTKHAGRPGRSHTRVDAGGDSR